MTEALNFNSDEDSEVVYSLSPIPEGISYYAGQWVSIRNREVILASQNLDDITASEEYDPLTDALYHVPEPGYQYYQAA